MPKPLPSSKNRYLLYLAERLKDLKDAKARKGEGDKGGSASVVSGEKSKVEKPKRDWTQAPEKPGKRKASRPFSVLMREFLRLLDGHRGKVLVAVTTVLIATGIGLITPIGAKITLDYVIAPTPEHLRTLEEWGWSERRVELGWWVALATLLVVGVSVLVATIGRYQLTRLNKLVQSDVRAKVFEHLSTLPLHKLSALKSGGVSSILRDDAGIVGEMLFSVLYNPLRALATLVGGLAAMAILDWRMLLGGLILLPAVWITHRTWIARIRPVYSAVKAARTNTDAQATEAFAGMRIVRAFDRRRGEAVRFAKNNHFMARQEMLVWWWSRIIEMIWMLIIPACTAIALAYGGSRVIEGKLTVGDIGAFLTYLGMILGPMELLVGTASQLQNGLAGWDRCLDILEEKPELTAESQAGVPTPVILQKPLVRGEVRFTDVSFTYPAGKEPVLSGINLHIPAGTTVALVGASGSGKTTLCNLVARFFDPSEGRIELDGVDLRSIDVGSYRRLLGIVEQDVFLFDGTVADNIAFADRDAPMARIIAAAEAANAHEFIQKLDKGYDTIIGERGVRLSGGQKQRVAIARALLADPKLLILDEATSNLDTQSERLIQASLSELMRERTSFVIAHRLSTIRDAGLIVVLRSGRIAEMGTHEELLERKGDYFAMLQVQLHTVKDFAGEEGEATDTNPA